MYSYTIPIKKEKGKGNLSKHEEMDDKNNYHIPKYEYDIHHSYDPKLDGPSG